MDDFRGDGASPQSAGATPSAMPAAPSALKDVRVRDPASRDQDAIAWRRNRFSERVRREWNPVQTAAIDATRSGDTYNLPVLAELIHGRIGGDKESILRRLQEFAALERLGNEPTQDRLVRPGAGV